MADKSLPSQLLAALQRTPGNLVGAPVDLANLLTGFLVGQGVGGAVPSDRAVGGSDWINSKFGLTEKGSTAQQSAEAVASLATPGGIAKGAVVGLSPLIATLLGGLKAAKSAKTAVAPLTSQRGVISVLTPDIADTLNITDVLDRAKSMAADGASWWKVGTESEKALASKRNPGGALSVFIGPDGSPQLKLDTAVARLAPSFEKKLQTRYYGPGDHELQLPKDMTAGVNLFGGNAAPQLNLSDILLHPSLYSIVPELGSTKVYYSPMLTFLGGGGVKGGIDAAGNIALNQSHSVPATLRNSPTEDLLRTLLHESTHKVQSILGGRGGTSTDIVQLRKQLDQARTRGSFRSSAELDLVDRALSDAANKGPDSEAATQILDRLYYNSYGEWVARQGSEKGRSLPMQYEKGRTW